jgi:hypothetical protein
MFRSPKKSDDFIGCRAFSAPGVSLDLMRPFCAFALAKLALAKLALAKLALANLANSALANLALAKLALAKASALLFYL